MSNLLNPYITGNPITGSEMFFGREDIFDFISQTLIGRYSSTNGVGGILLYGQSRMGKTSVLHQMRSRLDANYLCVFIDLHKFGVKDLSNFLLQLANHISHELRKNYNIDLQEGQDCIAFHLDPRKAFEDQFLNPLWHTIGNKHLLLMLDEAGQLQESGLAEGIKYMRYLMQNYVRLIFLFSLVEHPQKMQKEYTSLFNTMLLKKISFLDRTATSDLIIEPVKDCYQVEPAALDRIFQITSGHPYHIQLLCRLLFERWEKQPKSHIGLQDVEEIIGESIERGSMVHQGLWKWSQETEQAVMTGMAAAMGDTNRPVGVDTINQVWVRCIMPESDMASTLIIPKSDMASAIQSLVVRDIISGQEEYIFTIDWRRMWIKKSKREEYIFTVDLLRMWIKKSKRPEGVEEEIASAISQWKALIPARPVTAPKLQSDVSFKQIVISATSISLVIQRFVKRLIPLWISIFSHWLRLVRIAVNDAIRHISKVDLIVNSTVSTDSSFKSASGSGEVHAQTSELKQTIIDSNSSGNDVASSSLIEMSFYDSANLIKKPDGDKNQTGSNQVMLPPVLTATSLNKLIYSRRRVIAIPLALLAVGGLSITSLKLLQKQNSSENLSPGSTLYIYKNHSGSVWAVEWSYDSKYIASGSDDATVQVWDAMSGKNALVYKGHASAVNTVRWSYDDKRITSGSDDATVQVWDAMSGKNALVCKGSTDTGGVNTIDWSPSSNHIVAGYQDWCVREWDSSSGQRLYTFTDHNGPVLAVAWSLNGEYIASGGADGTIIVWDALSKNALLAYQGHLQFVAALAWSPDSKYIVTGGGDAIVKVWDAITGKQLFNYEGHHSNVNAVAWSTNGHYIASGGEDTTVKVWDVIRRREVLTYKGHSSRITAVAWSADSKYIASSGNDMTVRVWKAPT